MSKIRVILVAGLSTLAVSVMTADSVSAAWFVGGKELTTTAAVANLPHIINSIIIHSSAGGIPILVLCGGIHLINGFLIPPDIFFVQRVDFLKCHTIESTPTNCKLKGEVEGIPHLTLIGTTPQLLLILRSGRFHLKPLTGKLFAEVPFEEGTACALEGNIPIKGGLTLNGTTSLVESVGQNFEGLGSEENNNLEFGSGNKAFVLGRILLLLASGSKWSFH